MMKSAREILLNLVKEYGGTYQSYKISQALLELQALVPRETTCDECHITLVYTEDKDIYHCSKCNAHFIRGIVEARDQALTGCREALGGER